MARREQLKVAPLRASLVATMGLALVACGASEGGLVDAAPPDSTRGVCGDHVLAVGETCDDGNLRDGDGCAACSLETCAFGQSAFAEGAPAAAYLPAVGVESIVSADVDGDGDNDLAVVSSEALTVLRNDGGHAFGVSYQLPLAGRGESVLAADLDDDGDFDLLFVDETIAGLTFLLNDGAGSFTSMTGVVLGLAGAEQVTAGDLDGDGDTDLTIAENGGFNGRGDIVALYAVGPLRYDAVRYTVGSDPESLVLADLDGDGDLDIAAANESSNDVSVLRNDRDRSFTLLTRLPVGRDPESIAAGDVDGDTDVDLVVVNGFLDPTTGQIEDNTVSLLLNAGHGAFAPQWTYAVGRDPFALLLTDLDGDTDLDVVTANKATGDVSLLENDGRGLFAPERRRQADAGANALEAAALDDDCMVDVIVGNKEANAGAFFTSL